MWHLAVSLPAPASSQSSKFCCPNQASQSTGQSSRSTRGTSCPGVELRRSDDAVGLMISLGLQGHTDRVGGLAFSADGSSIATACDDRVVRLFRLTNAAAKNLTFMKHNMTSTPVDVAFGSASNLLAVTTKGAFHLSVHDWLVMQSFKFPRVLALPCALCTIPCNALCTALCTALYCTLRCIFTIGVVAPCTPQACNVGCVPQAS